MQDKEPVFEVRRKLRPVAGETGEIDAAAAYEALKGRTFTYKVYLNESCEVEMDEEPPHEMSGEALETALQVAIMLNCEIPEEIHVMRKTVLDGSNTAGFQRTAIVGLDGWVDTNFGKVGITNVSVEEDACQIMDKKVKDGTEFGLNRLGVPLVEIGTTPNIPNPEEAREVAEKIGMILRSTGRVRRGIGTIRQDLNVSVEGGARVEIKGVQDLGLIPKLIETEVVRQLDMIAGKQGVTKDVRRALPDGTTKYLRPLPGAARMYPETDCTPVEVSGAMLMKIRGSLPKLISETADELEKAGIAPDLAKLIARDEEKLGLFTELSKLKNIKPAFLASMLVSYRKEIRNKYPESDPERIKSDHIRKVFHAMDEGRITKDGLLELLGNAAKGGEIKIGSSGLGEEEVTEIIRNVIKSNPEALKAQNPEKAVMGLVMKEIRGRAPGALVMKILSGLIGKSHA